MQDRTEIYQALSTRFTAAYEEAFEVDSFMLSDNRSFEEKKQLGYDIKSQDLWDIAHSLALKAEEYLSSEVLSQFATEVDPYRLCEARFRGLDFREQYTLAPDWCRKHKVSMPWQYKGRRRGKTSK